MKCFKAFNNKSDDLHVFSFYIILFRGFTLLFHILCFFFLVIWIKYFSKSDWLEFIDFHAHVGVNTSRVFALSARQEPIPLSFLHLFFIIIKRSSRFAITYFSALSAENMYCWCWKAPTRVPLKRTMLYCFERWSVSDWRAGYGVSQVQAPPSLGKVVIQVGWSREGSSWEIPL